jgi:hypothetical protein
MIAAAERSILRTDLETAGGGRRTRPTHVAEGARVNPMDPATSRAHVGAHRRIKEIGLWGPKIRRAYSNMGIMGFAEIDVDALARQDEQVAADFDARHGRERTS